MGFEVIMKKKFQRVIREMPLNARLTLHELILDMQEKGPYRREYRNFSTLNSSGTKFHCHLGWSWVACWYAEKGSYIVEVYYVGSREKAPYD